MTASGPFGAACSAVPASGAGSPEALAQGPVATAASNTPELSTMVTAVKKAGLVDTLNSAQDITVFVPTNDAFSALPKPTLDKALATHPARRGHRHHHAGGRAAHTLPAPSTVQRQCVDLQPCAVSNTGVA